MTDDWLALAYQKLRDAPISSSPFSVDPQAPTWAKKVKAASLQGLPNELQVKIIDEIFSIGKEGRPINPIDSATQAYYRSHHYFRDVRCVVIGLVRTFPQFRSYILNILRVELMSRCWETRKVDVQRLSKNRYGILLWELITLNMLVTYLETGKIKKLKKAKDMTWDDVRIVESPDEPLTSAMKALWQRSFLLRWVSREVWRAIVAWDTPDVMARDVLDNPQWPVMK